jgi:hypothetical protein
MFIRNVLAMLSISLVVACGGNDSSDEPGPSDAQHEQDKALSTDLNAPELTGSQACDATCASACNCEYIACTKLGTNPDTCDRNQDDCFDECE